MTNLEKLTFNGMIGIKLIELESVGCVLDPDTLECYPMFGSGEADFENAVSLYDTDEEWFNNLSEGDKQLLIDNGLLEMIK